MDSDLFLTIGIILAILTLPVLLSAWVEGRVPRLGAILIIAAGGLFVTAMTQHSGGYKLQKIPDVMLRVIGRYLS
ncbi:hypothetical protein [Pseudogemmobacter faecipullorum]|uniref:50S ribosomal protein L35 n=1 Tax=Pseudogemmobacter faecipullorum TaxID=2755041 RepID=A0ABS8CJR8_9RHOB|nr:hypothetical protein [Pseudogemmobacter faecipullorum]MCB5409638.1 hypothetical protein [Pseudogemmobacter faecipullorum]